MNVYKLKLLSRLEGTINVILLVNVQKRELHKNIIIRQISLDWGLQFGANQFPTDSRVKNQAQFKTLETQESGIKPMHAKANQGFKIR